MSSSISWLREPISTSLTLAWRLRLYAACVVPVSRSRVGEVQAWLEASVAAPT